MKYFSLFIFYLIFQTANAADIPEVTIEKQNVILWNYVEFLQLETLRKDLADWCHEEHKNNCVGYDLRIYISTDKSTLFYQFSLTNVYDVFAIYLIKTDEQKTIYGKSWVDEFEHPLNKIKNDFFK